MRRAQTILAVLVAVANLAGCTPTSDGPAATIDGAFPPVGELPELPFRVVDHTGTLRGVSVVTMDDVEETVRQVPGRDDSISVMWIGGMCDRGVTIDLARTSTGHAMNVKTDRDFGGCAMAGVFRSLMFQFTEPVDASTLAFSTID